MDTKLTDFLFTDLSGTQLYQVSAVDLATAKLSFLGFFVGVERMIQELRIERHRIRIYHRNEKSGRWLLSD